VATIEVVVPHAADRDDRQHGSDEHHLPNFYADVVPVAYMLVGIVEPGEFAAAIKAGQPGPYANHMRNFKVDLRRSRSAPKWAG